MNDTDFTSSLCIRPLLRDSIFAVNKSLKLMKLTLVSLLLFSCTSLSALTGIDTPFGGSAERREGRAAYHFMNGNMLYQSGDLPAAVHEYELALKFDQEAGYIMSRLGAVKLKLGKIDEAEILADRALTIAPKSYEALILEADILLQRGKTDAALVSFKKAIEIDAHDTRLIFRIGGMEARRGNNLSAEYIYQIGAKNHPYIPNIHYVLGMAQKINEHYEESEKSFKTALELKADDRKILTALAELYEIQGKTKEAADTYGKIVQTNPNDLDARLKLVDLLAKSKQYDKAIQHLNKGRKFGLKEAEYRLGIALLSLERGDVKRAIREFEALRKEFPSSPHLTFYIAAAHYRLGNKKKSLLEYSNVPVESPLFADSTLRRALILEEMNRRDEGLVILEEGSRLNPKRTDIALVLVDLFRKAKEYDKALRVASLALNIEPENTSMLFAAGTIHGKKGNTGQASQMMEYIIKLDPKHALALNYLGYSLADQGENLERAKELILKALELRPGDPYIIDSLGWIHYKKGDYDKALANLRKASKLLPDDPTVIEHLGDVYSKKGNKKLALKHYRRALRLNPEDEQARQIKKKIRKLKRGR